MKQLPIVRKKNGLGGGGKPDKFEVFATATIDDEFFEHLSKFRWFMLTTTRNRNKPNSYVVRKKPKVGGVLFLHHDIFQLAGWGKPKLVDHIDGNTRNNLKSNLRTATNTNSLHNRRVWSVTGFKGVSRIGNRFQARIKPQNAARQSNLGCYATAEEAARAYDKAALQLFGEFALTNKAMGLY